MTAHERGFIEVRLTLLASDAGGRTQPIVSDYRPDWNIGGRSRTGEVELNGAPIVLQDCTSIATRRLRHRALVSMATRAVDTRDTRHGARDARGPARGWDRGGATRGAPRSPRLEYRVRVAKTDRSHMSDGKIIPLVRRRESKGRSVVVGGSVDETRLTLAIYGDAFDPDTVTKHLGVEPTSTQRKGDRLKPRYRAYQQSGWFLTLNAESPNGLEHLLRELLQRVPSPQSSIWKTLRDAYDVQLRIGIFMNAWNRGFTVDSTLIADAAHIADRFDFDIYASGDE